MLGPTLAGQIADACGGDLKIAFLFSLIFPVCAIALLMMLRRDKKIKRGNII
jgi:hypothetical protein